LQRLACFLTNIRGIVEFMDDPPEMGSGKSTAGDYAGDRWRRRPRTRACPLQEFASLAGFGVLLPTPHQDYQDCAKPPAGSS